MWSLWKQRLFCSLLHLQQRKALSRYNLAGSRYSINICWKIICLDSGLGKKNNTCGMEYTTDSFLNYVQFIIRNMQTKVKLAVLLYKNLKYLLLMHVIPQVLYQESMLFQNSKLYEPLSYNYNKLNNNIILMNSPKLPLSCK